MLLSDWQAAGKFYNYKTHQVFYREAGTGETMLLIHGFPTASWDWHRIWTPLTEKYHLLAPDLLGFGFSDKPRPYPYSIMDQADLLEQMLDKMGIRNFHILAHDYGDTVAQELLARWFYRLQEELPGPDIVSITLLNGGIFPELHQPQPVQKLLAGPAGIVLTPFMGKWQLRRTFNKIFGPQTRPSKKEIDEFWRLITYNRGKTILPRLIRYMQEREEHRDRWFHGLYQCPLPLTHINGTEDPISGRHMAEHFDSVIKQVNTFYLDGIGHYPQLEAPQQVLDILFRPLEIP